jgi:hypothetical protein
LNEVSKKRAIFEDQKKSFEAFELEMDQKKTLRIFIDGVKHCFAVKTVSRASSRRSDARRIISCNDPSLQVILKNVERFLEQARYDPSI